MNFMLPLRNAQTGEERNFFDKQQIADFLARCDNAQQWEGWAQLGPLPAAQVHTLGDDATATAADGY